jgi:CheY-like chemotaxis protein
LQRFKNAFCRSDRMSPDTPKLPKEMEEALDGFLQLAGVPKMGATISTLDLQIALEKLKAKVEGKGAAGAAAGATASKSGGDAKGTDKDGMPQKVTLEGKSILIAGEIGIITFQLKQVLTRLGGLVTIAKGVDEAISEYQRQDYTQVLIDLYMPTEREGLIVLEEIKRLKTICQLSTEILIISSPTKEKKLKEMCKTKGANCYLEKTEGWHKRIIDFCLGRLVEETSKF